MRIHALTEEGKTASKAKLEALRAADDLRRKTSQAKNDLESYILKVTEPILCIYYSIYLCFFLLCFTYTCSHRCIYTRTLVSESLHAVSVLADAAHT